jgi:hypothetical protein
MPRKKKWGRRDIPHCADPENHVLVKTREGVHWRKKRRKGKLNEGFATNADLSKITGPAASNVVQRLRPFLKGIDGGRLTLRISNALRKGLKEKKRLDLSALEGVEMQRDYPLHQLLLVPYLLEVEDSMFKIKIGIESKCVKKQNSLATHFYFEAVMVYGDVATENGLRVASIGSRLYAFGEGPEEVCKLSLPLPEKKVSWMALLKVSCLEGNEMGHHPKHYGMKVVKGR